MPTEITITSLLILFVIAFFLGAGWTLGCWLMGRILGVLGSRSNT